LQVNGADTSLVLDGVEMADGARNGTAVYTHPADDPGELRLRNCVIENWHIQGLYGSPHGGPMHVVGGRYANNGEAQVRVGGGGADTESVIRDVTVHVSDPQPATRKQNIRGIWLKEGEGTLVENCDVRITNLSDYGSSGALVVGPEQGRATIRDTSIQVDASTFAISAPKPKEHGFVIPSLDHPPENWDVTCENVEISGTASGQVAVWVVGRPNCAYRNVDVNQRGENRDGLGVFRSPETVIENCSCVTSSYPLIANFQDASQECNLVVRDIRNFESRSIDGGADGINIQGSEGRYCIQRSQFELTEDRPGIGVLRQHANGLYVQTLPKRHLTPF
jgi:hypothetical protein